MNVLSKKRQEGSYYEMAVDTFYRSNLAGLKDYYNGLCPNEDIKKCLNSVHRRHILPKVVDTSLYPLKDANLQATLTHEITGLVNFIESNFLLNINRIAVKFSISKNGRPVFIGAKHCFFNFKHKGHCLLP